MDLFIFVDDLEVAVEGILEASSDEGCLRVVGKPFLVELALKVSVHGQQGISGMNSQITYSRVSA